MKAFSLPLGLIMMILMIASCGKKTEVKDMSEVPTMEPTVAEVYFNAFRELKRAVLEDDLPAVKKTIAENPGIDLNQTLNDTGETFLIIAIKKDYREIRNYLIDKAVQLEKANVNKETPLIAAVAHGRVNSVQVLLDQKVDLERRDGNGDTALHVAIKKSNDEIALLLIKHGANVEVGDKRDLNALKLAQEYHVPQSLQLIKSILQVESGAPDIASYRTVLLQADHKRLSDVLSRYPKIAVDHAYESINPLAILVGVKDENNALRSAELLINHEANVNGPLDADQTPLIKATVLEKKGFVNLFLSSDANPQLMDTEGKSALIHAVELNNLELVNLLLSYSAVKKYTFIKKGDVRISFNACDVAKKTQLRLKTDEALATNKKIKDRLNCGLFRWSF